MIPLSSRDEEINVQRGRHGKHELGCQYARDDDDAQQHVDKIVR